MVVVPDEQAHTDESEQELEGYDENYIITVKF
jgi:hypothetical protein